MGNGTTEERLAALEAEVVHIKAQLRGEPYSERPGVIGRTNPEQIEKLFGHAANSPLAEQVWQDIEAEREREREEARRRGQNDYEAA